MYYTYMLFLRGLHCRLNLKSIPNILEEYCYSHFWLAKIAFSHQVKYTTRQSSVWCSYFYIIIIILLWFYIYYSPDFLLYFSWNIWKVRKIPLFLALRKLLFDGKNHHISMNWISNETFYNLLEFWPIISDSRYRYEFYLYIWNFILSYCYFIIFYLDEKSHFYIYVNAINESFM